MSISQFEPVSEPAGSPHTSRDGLERQLGIQLDALLAGTRIVSERIAEQFHPELYPAAFHLAVWLYTNGATKPSEISDALDMDRAATTGHVGKLRKLGLAETAHDERDPSLVVVKLTELGRERVLDTLRRREAEFAARIQGWSDAEVRGFSGALGRFNASLDLAAGIA
jgi:DNA-binding MarR family transcriptional regulator